MPSGLISTSAGSTGASSTARAAASKAVADRPWKERDQSTGSVGAVGSGERGSAGVAGSEDGVAEAEEDEDEGEGEGEEAVVRCWRGGNARGALGAVAAAAKGVRSVCCWRAQSRPCGPANCSDGHDAAEWGRVLTEGRERRRRARRRGVPEPMATGDT
jgi:hypothetical protein